MKFGTVPEQRLHAIDLSLPAEPFINTLVLTGHRVAAPKIYLGSAHWGHASWNGPVYPSRTPQARFRQWYPQAFNSIELNATHYRIYPPEVLQQWGAAARGRDFKFCPKFPQLISHEGHLKDAVGPTEEFLHSIAAFGSQLGPSFLQMSEHFSPAQKDGLYHYLGTLPTGGDYFLELRHPQWFASERQTEDLFNTLRSLHIGAVITDTPGRRDAVHMHLTIPKVFLRFVCNSLHPTTFSRMDEWTGRLQHWIDNGLEEAYIFLHPGDETSIPQLATYWLNALNKACKLELPLPGAAQNRLF